MHYLKIIAGGQTGVDTGALDFALDNHFPCGGYCPQDRKNENGKIPLKYPLTEINSNNYIDRTLRNVIESDGTLIIKDKLPLKKGSVDTIALCKKYKKPFFIAEINLQSENRDQIIHWLEINNIKILNVAGNRESQSPGIAKKTYTLLKFLFQHD
ncbi:MAG: putative molybdenum carrier protein [Bacteroidota bacterium]|nr:putative molybdenum carrier protein [Bacteroidota bacterium]